MRCPGSGVVLDCIDSRSLSPFLFCILEITHIGSTGSNCYVSILLEGNNWDDCGHKKSLFAQKYTKGFYIEDLI